MREEDVTGDEDEESVPLLAFEEIQDANQHLDSVLMIQDSVAGLREARRVEIDADRPWLNGS